MNRVSITDANIFIDLFKLDLLPLLFLIGYEIQTTGQVCGELHDYQLEAIIGAVSLVVYSLTSAEIDELGNEGVPSGLSSADRSVLLLAHKVKDVVLTGERILRRVLESNSIEVHGIIWIFDEFVNQGLLAKRVAAEKLIVLKTINTRLPLREIEIRIRDWGR